MMVYFKTGRGPRSTKWKTEESVILSNEVVLISDPDIFTDCSRSGLDENKVASAQL